MDDTTNTPAHGSEKKSSEIVDDGTTPETISFDFSHSPMPFSTPAFVDDGVVARMCPYHHLVPRDFLMNLRFREALIELAQDDEEMQDALWIMCARDPVFFVNSFMWTYDPRKNPPIIPFVLYPYQVVGLLELVKSVNKEDVFIEKSRDMGASWVMLAVVFWLFLFHDAQSILLLSRKEDLVDKKGDPDAMFSKLDMCLEKLPAWMKPAMERRKLHLENLDNKSVVSGDSTTGDAGRGGRRGVVVCDEFASVPEGSEVLKSTRDVTRSRWFNSTPKGTGNAFYDLRLTDIKRLCFHWTLHPEKAHGLYYKDGKPHSVWYDRQCKRAAHPMEIAQELDIDYMGSDFQFFTRDLVDDLLANTFNPMLVGRIKFDHMTAFPEGFESTGAGRWQFWIAVDEYGRPPMDEYIVAADIAAGTGASNSAISIGSAVTGQKVAEYANPNIAPSDLALEAVAAARLFRNTGEEPAKLIWESNGPGQVFGRTVGGLGFKKIYYRSDDKSGTRTDIAGWHSTVEEKLTLYTEYRKQLKSRYFINPSWEAIRELREIIYFPNGSVGHVKTNNSTDPSGARSNHADRCTADALLSKMMASRRIREAEDKIKTPTQDTVMGRRLARIQENAKIGALGAGW